MLSIEQSSQVLEIIVDKTSKQEAFTAYDITKEMRKLGERVAHFAVKELVHYLMATEISNGLEYSKILEDMPNGGPAFMYRFNEKCQDDDNDECEDDGADGDCNDCYVSGGVTVDTVILSPDSRKRYCIPASIVRNIGLYPGAVAYCYLNDEGDEKSIVIEHNYNSGDPLTCYIVDKDNNIRVSSKILRAIDDSVEYTCSSDMGGYKIVIRKA